MKNKVLIGILLACLFLEVIGMVFGLIGWENGALSAGLRVTIPASRLLGLYLLISNGSITKTIYWKIILVFSGILIFGIIGNNLSWPFADPFLGTGAFGISIIYLIRFFTKSKIGHLDILKVLCVLTTFSGVGLALMGLFKFIDEIEDLYILFFWLMVLDFILLETRNPVPAPESESEPDPLDSFIPH